MMTHRNKTYLNVCVLTKTIFCNENNESIFYQSVIFVKVCNYDASKSR